MANPAQAQLFAHSRSDNHLLMERQYVCSPPWVRNSASLIYEPVRNVYPPIPSASFLMLTNFRLDRPLMDFDLFLSHPKSCKLFVIDWRSLRRTIAIHSRQLMKSLPIDLRLWERKPFCWKTNSSNEKFESRKYEWKKSRGSQIPEAIPQPRWIHFPCPVVLLQISLPEVLYK